MIPPRRGRGRRTARTPARPTNTHSTSASDQHAGAVAAHGTPTRYLDAPATGAPVDPACLFALYHRCWDGCWDYSEDRGIFFAGREPGHRCWVVQEWPITKVTPKRIYFRGGAGCAASDVERTFFLARDAFDANGTAYHRGVRERLYLARPELPGRHRPTPEDRRAEVSRLRAEMADAHPDRGGSSEAFIAARAAYTRVVSG